MSIDTAPRLRSRGFAFLMGAVTLAAFALLIALGTWQVQRLQWKEELIATIDARINAAPVSLADIEARYPDIEYVPVSLAGRFDHAAERHFFTTYAGQSGYNVYAPLMLADGRAIFVNRGFVPYDRKDPATRAEGQVAGEVTVIGLARAGLVEKPSAIVPDNDPAANLFYWKDIREMAASSGLPQAIQVLPFFVDAADAPNPGGLPVGGATIVELPNNHLQYAVTWYGLAAALAGVSLVWLVRRFRAKP